VFAGEDALSPTPPSDELRARFPAAQIVVLDGADHFFRDHEAELERVVRTFVEDAVTLPGSPGAQS